MAMTANAFSVNEHAPSYSLTALALLADPVSTLLDRDRLVAIAAIALRQDRPTTHAELTVLRDCARELRWLRPKLKQSITFAYAWGLINANTAQLLIDFFEFWDD
jgi:hypothetical protein